MLLVHMRSAVVLVVCAASILVSGCHTVRQAQEVLANPKGAVSDWLKDRRHSQIYMQVPPGDVTRLRQPGDRQGLHFQIDAPSRRLQAVLKDQDIPTRLDLPAPDDWLYRPVPSAMTYPQTVPAGAQLLTDPRTRCTIILPFRDLPGDLEVQVVPNGNDDCAPKEYVDERGNARSANLLHGSTALPLVIHRKGMYFAWIQGGFRNGLLTRGVYNFVINQRPRIRTEQFKMGEGGQVAAIAKPIKITAKYFEPPDRNPELVLFQPVYARLKDDWDLWYDVFLYSQGKSDKPVFPSPSDLDLQGYMRARPRGSVRLAIEYLDIFQYGDAEDLNIYLKYVGALRAEWGAVRRWVRSDLEAEPRIAAAVAEAASFKQRCFARGPAMGEKLHGYDDGLSRYSHFGEVVSLDLPGRSVVVRRDECVAVNGFGNCVWSKPFDYSFSMESVCQKEMNYLRYIANSSMDSSNFLKRKYWDVP